MLIFQYTRQNEMKSQLFWTVYTETCLAILQKKWWMSTASFRSRGVPAKRHPGKKQQTHRRTTTWKCDPNRVAMQLFWNHTSTRALPCESAASPQNTPLLEHLCQAACVFSYLKLIIRIIQQILSYARNFYKLYKVSF